MMRRRIPGPKSVAAIGEDVPDGFYLVRVDRLHYRWDRQKPFFSIRLSIIEPVPFAGRSISGRLDGPQGTVEAVLVPAISDTTPTCSVGKRSTNGRCSTSPASSTSA